MTKKIDFYNNEIYPFTLCVCKGCTAKDLNKLFTYTNGSTFEEADFDQSPIFTAQCMSLKDKKYVIAVIKCYKDKALTKQEDLIEDVLHETFHVLFHAFDQIGADLNSYNQEPAAYLQQWIGKCIYKTLK